MTPLPIDSYLAEIRDTLRRKPNLVISAPPGSGKTTRIPPALAADGPVLVLQPRRVAARSLAKRIAEEQGWRLGEEVGWQVRGERRFGPGTRLLVATEGILTARLQSDPLVSDFRTVILDEFHERSIHSDLALALLSEALAARDDLRLVIMSATLDCGPVSEYLGGCPVLEVEARTYPVELEYREETSPAAAIREVLAGPGGHVLCFLPGAGEIAAVERDLGSGPPLHGVKVLPLHGSLSADRQDAALAPSVDRKVILATNVAETSLTVEGVTHVVDCGYHKVMRFDPSRGVDRLQLERIPLDCATQRAGRAGRTQPGKALRLWDSRLTLRAHREPEIGRIDLAATFLAVFAWGGDPLRLRWFEAPPRHRVEAALQLLDRLGLIESGLLTERGRRLQRLPLHPRLACFMAAAGPAPEAAQICAVLSESRTPPAGPPTRSRCDPLVAAGRLDANHQHSRLVEELLGMTRRALAPANPARSEDELLQALLAGFPDRVAQRREPGSDRLLLASGHGARLSRLSGVHDGEYLLALELISTHPEEPATVTQAAQIQKQWLKPTALSRRHFFDAASESVKCVEEARYDHLVLWERPSTPDPGDAAGILATELARRGLDPDQQEWVRRASLAGVPIDVEGCWIEACRGQVRLPKLDLGRLIPAPLLHRIRKSSPDFTLAPNGRRLRIRYLPEGPRISAKLQDLFGLLETPTVGIDRTPVLVELLAPNGRPVQLTRDLRSFWATTYAQVRKELRGRYPKHAWPEDPFSPRADR